jgi:hypothetical protein
VRTSAAKAGCGKSFYDEGVASAAKAAVDFEALTARLEAAPFQNEVAGRVFPQPCPFRS